MAAREFLMLVTETAYGTAKTSPTLGTDSIYVRLGGDNSFTVVGDPMWYEVMYGGGQSIPAYAGSDQCQTTGNLTTELCGSQAVFLSNWFAQRTNGSTSPWTYSGANAGDLLSVSCYHAVRRSDGTFKRAKFPGTKVKSWKVDCSRDSKIAKLSLSLVSQKWVGNSYDASADPDATVFPAPADTAYPTDPFRFIDLAGNFTVGSSRTLFDSLSVSCENDLDPKWFETRWLSILPFFGRKTTLSSNLLYKPSPDDLASYQSQTVQAVSAKFDNGTNSLSIGMNANNLIKKIQKQLGVPKVYELQTEIQNYFDTTAGTDLTVVAA